jgi:peroxiredoxin
MKNPVAIAEAPVLSRDQVFVARELQTIASGRVRIPDATRLVHLQLRRYAGCPICSLHLRSFARRYHEVVAAGVLEVVVFHSSFEDLSKVHIDQPVAVVPDPERRLYDELGVGTSVLAMTNPSVWLAAARAVTSGAARHSTTGAADGSFGLPGDFLIDNDGRIVACYRGLHADDQWSVDELLRIVALYHRSK